MASRFRIDGLLVEKFERKGKNMLKYLISMGAQSIHWRCTKCGRTADSSIKPGATYGGPCHSASNGKHTWTKSHF